MADGTTPKRRTFPKGNKIGNRFKPGESGNPDGRPQGSRNVSTILREMMERIAPDDIVDAKFVKEFCKGKKTVTNADAVAARLLKASIVDGESWAVREVFDRIDGKPKQSMEVDMSVDWLKTAMRVTEDDIDAEKQLIAGSFDDPSNT